MLSWSRHGAFSNRKPAQRQSHNNIQRGLLALTASCCAGTIVQAQELAPGVLATFDVTQRLEYSDNPGLDPNDSADSDFFGRTILGFGLDSVTSIQRFSLNLGTDIEEFLDTNDKDFNFDNSFGTLNYVRSVRNASAEAILRYRDSDVDGEFSDDDFDQDGDIITSDGSRQSFGYTLRGAVGEEAPVGASFRWDYNEINFEDTDNGDDSTLERISAQVDFQISPLITLSLTGRYSDFDTENAGGTDRRETGLGVAAGFDVSPILSMNVGLSYDEIERRGGTNADDDGGSLSIDVVRLMPNGTVGLNYSSEVFANDDGRRSFFSVNRDMALPSGALAFALGVTGTDAVGTDPLIQASYEHELPTGQLTFGFSQRVVVDDEDEEDINTSLNAGYSQQVTPLSSLGVNVRLFDRNVLDGDTNDSQRVELGLSYRYDLTEDWGLVSGITHTRLTEDNTDDRDRTTIFVGIQRSFQFSP